MPVMLAEAFLTIHFSLFTAHQALPWLILTVALGISALIGRHSLPRSWRRVRKISPEQVLDHKPSEEPVGPRMLCRRIVERAEQIRRAMLEDPSEIEIDMCAMGYGACLEDMGLLNNVVKAELSDCTPIQRCGSGRCAASRSERAFECTKSSRNTAAAPVPRRGT